MGENGHKQNVPCSSSLCFLDKHIRISDGICPSCAHLQHYCQAAGDPLPKACPSWPDRIVLADQAEFLKTLLQFWFNSVGWRMILWICSAISVRDEGEISHVKHTGLCCWYLSMPQEEQLGQSSSVMTWDWPWADVESKAELPLKSVERNWHFWVGTSHPAVAKVGFS